MKSLGLVNLTAEQLHANAELITKISMDITKEVEEDRKKVPYLQSLLNDNPIGIQQFKSNTIELLGSTIDRRTGKIVGSAKLAEIPEEFLHARFQKKPVKPEKSGWRLLGDGQSW